MGFTLKVEGNTTIELGTTSITGVKVSTDIPQDSNARSTDLGSTITVTGKILTAVDGDPFDATRQLGLWAPPARFPAPKSMASIADFPSSPEPVAAEPMSVPESGIILTGAAEAWLTRCCR